MSRLITVTEALNLAKMISQKVYLTENIDVKMFFLFKNRYNDNIVYFAWFTPFGYAGWDNINVLMHKIIDNVKENEFVSIAIDTDNYPNDNFRFTNDGFINTFELNEFFVNPFVIGKKLAQYYKDKNTKFYGMHCNEMYDYIESIDECKTICNSYIMPKLMNLKDCLSNKFSEFSNYDDLLNYGCFVVTNNSAFESHMLESYVDLKTFINECDDYIPAGIYTTDTIKFICIHNYVNDKTFCTDNYFINYYVKLSNEYIKTHYLIDIIKQYFKDEKNIKFDFAGYEKRGN